MMPGVEKNLEGGYLQMEHVAAVSLVNLKAAEWAHKPGGVDVAGVARDTISRCRVNARAR